jgi:NADPH:quinone reductase-like Zn-dependent oxidoreductase
MRTHLAAVSTGKGQPFELQSRPTPEPGPDELLIAVKSVALNPADVRMRDEGLFISTYPTVLGFDIAGLVLKVGENVPTTVSRGDSEKEPGLHFRPGMTRVAAYAAAMWRSLVPDYGAFQEQCLVPWQHAIPLPDEGISWNHAATLPVAIEVPLNAWDVLGIPRVTSISATPNRGGANGNAQKREALLIWGASSSVGSMGVQSARVLREDPDSAFAAVYATAGAANLEYVSSLGADRVFDHRDPRVVDAIVSAAKEDGLVIRHCFLAMGSLGLCQAVMRAFVQQEEEEGKENPVKIASAPIVPPDAEVIDGVETTHVLPSMTDEQERQRQFLYWLGTWGRENLMNGNIRPSPEPQVVGKGLEAINVGLDMLRQGVSCAKLVIEVGE